MVADLSKITERQQKMWSTGDFHRVGVAQVVVGEMPVRSLHVHAGERVLDVAGNGDCISALEARLEHAEMCHHDTPGMFGLFRDWFGPISTAWQALDKPQQDKFRDAWIANGEKFNVAQDGTCEIHSEYLEVVAVKA